MKVHNKLVRDKIPEIIEKDGKTCVTHILSGEKYIVALETKLNEEVAEYRLIRTLKKWLVYLKFFRRYAWQEVIAWMSLRR